MLYDAPKPLRLGLVSQLCLLPECHVSSALCHRYNPSLRSPANADLDIWVAFVNMKKVIQNTSRLSGLHAVDGMGGASIDK